MPPRYAYWTILIDRKPTAFRARERDELLPTLHQLRRTNTDVIMMWFARGRLWESPEAELAARIASRQAPKERRGPEWRPGGAHADPRARFKKGDRRPERPRGPWKPEGDRRPERPRGPWKPSGARPPGRPPGPRGPRGPWKKGGGGKPRG
jgi:hypothetical protein